MLSGEYNVTLDDTGRIALPRKLRDYLNAGKIMLTKGADANLWMFTLEQWEWFKETIFSTTDMFTARGRRERQQFIGPLQELDIDRQGRIVVPPTLRDHAGLCRECIILGQGNYIEIWDVDRYKAYLNDSEEDFKAGLEEIGAVFKRERESGGYGNNAHSGITGGDRAIPRAEGQG